MEERGMATRKTQCEMVLDWLEHRGPIDPLKALDQLGILRLGARIWDLRQEGHEIERVMTPQLSGTGRVRRVATYRLVRDAEAAVGAVA